MNRVNTLAQTSEKSRFMKLEYMEMLADGLHPNVVGYEWMAKKIAIALQSDAGR